jgi:excisionase family DNA binding protein
MATYTTRQAAARLGITPSRVRQFCREGRLKAVKFGRDWEISSASLNEFVKVQRRAGRPRG